VTAAAHKLVRLMDSMLTKGEEYTDQGQACYEEDHGVAVCQEANDRPAQIANHHDYKACAAFFQAGRWPRR
jgi:hypothetical protein